MAHSDFSSQDFDAMLDDFIKRQLEDTEEELANIQDSSTKPSIPLPSDDTDDIVSANIASHQDTTEDNPSEDDLSIDDLPDYIASTSDDDEIVELQEEEKRLYNSYREFIKSTSNCANEHQIAIPEFYFSATELLPRFSPKRTANLKADIASCWDILIAAESEKLSQLPTNASDEQILDFAEKISAPNLQLSLISYVETLIEIDACEAAYNLRLAKYQKHKIEKELYEEKQKIAEKKRLYAQAVREHKFPVDAELLVNNFFKTSGKDPVNARKILETNPATFAPIQVDKIPDRFFGLIKAGPEDGKIVNKKLGKFLIKLKK